MWVDTQTDFSYFIKCDYVDYIKKSKEDFSNHCIAIVCPIAFLGWVAKDFKELCKGGFFQFSTTPLPDLLHFLALLQKHRNALEIIM